MDEATTALLSSRFMDALPRKEYVSFYMHGVYRLFYARHLQQQGKRYPSWLG
jgi:hypothetical protein